MDKCVNQRAIACSLKEGKGETDLTLPIANFNMNGITFGAALDCILINSDDDDVGFLGGSASIKRRYRYDAGNESFDWIKG